MKESTPMGMNRTGMQMSPFDSTRMPAEPAATQPQAPAMENSALAAMRSAYIDDADPVGSVPMPGTVAGAVSTGFQMLAGNNPKLFVDKLGERLAFERMGARLYDALITKLEASGDHPGSMRIEDLKRIRADEARHFSTVAQAMDELGADPTAETPCADLAGVESMGLVKVINDPRTTVTQSLHAILIGELTDQIGWEVLIALARENQQSAMADEFTLALNEEREHLRMVQQWYQEALLGHALDDTEMTQPLRH